MKKPRYIKLKIEILTRVRKLIEERQTRGLCYALILDNCAKRQSHSYSRAWDDLSKYINSHMDGYGWLDSWQQAHGLRPRNSYKIRQDRLDWIDWMIADYQKWG